MKPIQERNRPIPPEAPAAGPVRPNHASRRAELRDRASRDLLALGWTIDDVTVALSIADRTIRHYRSKRAAARPVIGAEAARIAKALKVR